MTRITFITCFCLLFVTCANTAFARAAAILPHVVAPAVSVQPVIRPVTVQEQFPISFGSFTTSQGMSGSITINPTGGVRTSNGGVYALNGAEFGSAQFNVIGQPDAQVIITLPVSVTLNASRGGNLSLTNLVAAPNGIITLDKTGRAKVNVGGTLVIPGGNFSGAYNGNFNINVMYVN